jgi:hypothetical protein
MTAYTTILTNLIIAASTLIGVFITNKAQKERLELQITNENTVKNNELMREKLEELYLLFKEWTKYISITHMYYTEGVAGHLDYSSVMDLVLERGKENTENFDRITMLIDLYFPHLRDEYNIVETTQKSANEIISEYTKNHLDGMTGKRCLVQLFSSRQELFSQQSNIFQNIISQQAENLIKS